MSAKPIFVGGASSHAGKSWMTTAICAYLKRRGCRVAPFKAQNMSNNSFPCPEGGEIGRAQVAQAEACGIEPHPDMNPILLKPNSETGSQIVLNGKVWGDLRARDYYSHFDFFLNQVLDAYSRLAARFDYVVLEGAGSVAELNLKSRDLVNLGLAKRIGAPAILVGDIDRGGVFAQIAGTMWLLDEDERALVRTFAVNKFRGDRSLFDDGVRILEEKTGRPCLGVFPFAREIHLDAEDGVSFEEANEKPAPTIAKRVAIVALPHISNLTDFRLLAAARRVTQPVPDQFDAVFLPGSKATMADLAWMRSRGLDAWVHDQHAGGATVIGVCGGYQMMGERIDDPHRVESRAESAAGLGLLPVRTTMRREKTTRAVKARTASGIEFDAYEIHMGETERTREVEPFVRLGDGALDGAVVGRCIGTYLHGALENRAVLSELLGCEVEAAESKAAHYGRLADWFESNADLELFERL